MQSKTSDDRRRQILERARSAGSVTVVAIAEGLNVSAETVRRDFKVLEDHGLLRRTHGGAHPVDGAGFETGVSQSAEYLLGEKRRIAVAAVDSLGDAESLYVDEGFTPGLVAQKLLKLRRPLTVVTSSLAVAGTLGEGDRHGVDRVHRHGDRQGHVDVGVAQGEERRAAAWVELDDLALDPQLAHPVDVVGDLEAEHPHRPRLLGRGVGGLVGQRARHAHPRHPKGVAGSM